MFVLPFGECCTENLSAECLVRTTASTGSPNPRNLSQYTGNLSSSFRSVSVSLPVSVSLKKYHNIDP